jgi:hypothetical protein
MNRAAEKQIDAPLTKIAEVWSTSKRKLHRSLRQPPYSIGNARSSSTEIHVTDFGRLASVWPRLG